MASLNYMSDQEKEEAEREMKLAQAELARAQENQKLAQLEWKQRNSQLKRRILRSPLDGVVTDQMLYPGEVVEPSGQKKAILTLASLDPLTVYAVLLFTDFGKVKQDMSVIVYPEEPTGGKHQAEIRIIDRVVDAASGTFGVYINRCKSFCSII